MDESKVMKKYLWIFIYIVFAIVLSGCSCYWNAGCHYPNERCNEHQVYTPCGSYIDHLCENICSQCKFNEPECTLCWNCIDTNECPVASQFQYCCKGTNYTM